MPKYDIEVQLTGTDGNAFAVMGKVSEALKSHGVNGREVAEYIDESMTGDYDKLLQTAMRWVNIL